jgi:hypothetical protein
MKMIRNADIGLSENEIARRQKKIRQSLTMWRRTLRKVCGGVPSVLIWWTIFLP